MPIIEAPIEIVTSPKRYPPVGHCIYCGAYTNRLSKEHIIPFGLAADSLILPKASCETCRSITQRHETTILRTMWWPFRTRIGAPTKHDAPKDFNVHQGMVEEFELPWITKMKHAGTIKVAPHEFPFAIITLKFPEPPAILVGRDPAAYVDWEVWTRYSEEEVKKYLGQDKKSIHLAPVEPDTFLRFLAKMAHGYAVGELGEKTFDPTLTHFIRNMPLRALEWIGGQKNDPPATESLHDIQWEIQTVEQINYVVVNLRLFSCFGTPPYRIVVGKIRCPLDSLPLIKQPLYTIDIKRTMPFREQNADHQ